MKLKRQISWTLLLVTLSVGFLQAQHSTVTSGGNASGIGGTVSYSLGQVAYTIAEGSGGFVAQGVQQPFEIAVVLDLDEAKGITLHSTLYPNPTSGSVTLQIENYDIQDLSYTIFDLNGRILSNDKISSNQTQISMGNFAKEMYHITIMKFNKELKTFKIIKN
jgi:hypothetical protein